MRHLFALTTLAFGPHLAIGRARVGALRTLGHRVLVLLDQVGAHRDRDL